MNIDAHRSFPVRECPGCAMDVPANHNRCPLCGYQFPGAGPFRRRLPFWGSLGLLILFALLALRLI